MQRMAHNAARITHEAQEWKENCFITLTYGTGNLPANASLEHRDYQLFMKRLRKREDKTIRFYMCGEYGELNGRPHYHACLFNMDFYDRKEAGKSGAGEQIYTSSYLEELWGHGRVSVQNLTPQTAKYTAGYILKKTLGDDSETAYNIVTEDGEILHREPPYSKSSNKPGIGYNWLVRHGKTDAFAHQEIIVKGEKLPLPPYYKKLQKRWGLVTERTEQIRMSRASKQDPREQWPDRQKVREEVHLAKIRNLKREL